MATSHKLIRTSQVGYALLERLNSNTADAQELLLATKKASECNPDGILPDADLKTMRGVFDDLVEDTDVIQAFEPYKEGKPGNHTNPKAYVVYHCSQDFDVNGLSRVIVSGGNNTAGQVPQDGMTNSVKVPLSEQVYHPQSTFEIFYDPSDFDEELKNFKVNRDGIYNFSGEFSLRVYPMNIRNEPWRIDTYYPPVFLSEEDDSIKYRITLQQHVGGDGPYDTEPFRIVDNFVIAEGAFSKMDIVKGATVRTGYNVILRANHDDRFRIIIERSKTIAVYPGDVPDGLAVVKFGASNADPYYGNNLDASNFIQGVLLLDSAANTPGGDPY